MTTARDLVNRAIRRAGIVSIGDSVPAEDADTALDAFNDMLFGWKSKSVDIGHSAYTLNSTVMFFVPPQSLNGGDIDALTNKGNWDASANSPSLSTGVGTLGDYYKVATAGSTTLDGITSWAVDDYLVYNGTKWIKGANSKQLEWAVMALLTLRISDEFGMAINPSLAEQADDGWRAVQAAFVRAPLADFDGGLKYIVGRRYGDEVVT